MNLELIYITNRDHPEVEWFLDSLGEQVDVIIVDGQFDKRPHRYHDPHNRVRHIAPKPTVWAGPHRLTKEEWWAAANARNTGICLCKHEFIGFVDDRSILLPGWLDRARVAMTNRYIVAGAYQKAQHMIVEKGVIKSMVANPGRDSRLDRLDPRLEYVEKYWVHHSEPPYKCPGEWTYGCSIIMPLEWILTIGGWDETCDGAGGEDSIMGLQAHNNGYPIYFDPQMKIVEDRTPEFSQPVMQRKDFGVEPNDFSHKLLEMLRYRKTARHGFDIRKLRDDALAGKPWPAPWGPRWHLWDNTPLGEL